jgi:hypothetical protein
MMALSVHQHLFNKFKPLGRGFKEKARIEGVIKPLWRLNQAGCFA